MAHGGVDGAQAAGQLQPGEEVFLHVTDSVFDAPFFVGFAHIAGAGLKAVMGRKIEVARMERGLFPRKDGAALQS